MLAYYTQTKYIAIQQKIFKSERRKIPNIETTTEHN